MDRPPSSIMDYPGPGRPSIPGHSIVLKLTLFVGSLVGLTAGTLITVGYYYTGRMLSDQVDARLSGIADDRQALLKSGLLHLEDRARLVASRTRLRDLMDQLARGAVTVDTFRTDAIRILDDVRAGSPGFLALWIEDDAGSPVASSGRNDLVALFAAGGGGRIAAGRENALVELPRPVD